MEAGPGAAAADGSEAAMAMVVGWAAERLGVEGWEAAWVAPAVAMAPMVMVAAPAAWARE